MSWGYDWKPYVSVADRRAQAAREMAKLRKKGVEIEPVTIAGRIIARTFWGKGWCDHLESFSDYQNRLPRGRTYVRNGSVCHLDIKKGQVEAIVSGSSLYRIRIDIETLPTGKWKTIKKKSAGRVGSLLELLQGKLSDQVMTVVTDRSGGMFPSPGEIKLGCNCPDWAVMCKHVAAVMYGVGARLDDEPELLFRLRGVDHEELIDAEAGVATATATATRRANGKKGGRLLNDSLADVFGIDLADEEEKGEAEEPEPEAAKGGKARTRATRATAKRSPNQKRSAPVAAAEKAITGKAVCALRAKFGMSQSEFARFLSVSIPSVAKWEKETGVLKLRDYSRQALGEARKISKREAWRVLREQV